MAMRLELGAGDRPTPGFTHLDLRPLDDIEIVGDAEHLDDHVEPESVDELRATHLLEHISHLDTQRVLEEWCRSLKPGGSLYIEVPNLMWAARALVNGSHDPEHVVFLLYGGQDYADNFHRTAFTEETLRRALDRAGFVDIQIQDIVQVLIATARKGE